MNRKSSLVLLTILLSGLLCSALAVTTKTVRADPDPPIAELSLNAPTLLPAEGESFNVTLHVDNVTNLSRWWISDLSWNCSVLQITHVTEGPFLKTGGDTFFISAIDSQQASEGVLPEIVESLFVNSGVNGTGDLATVTFQVLDRAPTNITIASSEFLTPDTGDLTPESGDGHQEIEHTQKNLSIQLSDVSPTYLASQQFVEAGFNLSVNDTLNNNGTTTETIAVQVYANTSLIHTENFIVIGNSSTSITCTCNTTGLALGNYTLSICVFPVAEASAAFGNTLTSNTTVLVTYVGDLTGDFRVDSNDIAAFCDAYNAYWGSGIVNPAADFNHDNIINSTDSAAMVDAYIAYWS